MHFIRCPENTVGAWCLPDWAISTTFSVPPANLIPVPSKNFVTTTNNCGGHIACWLSITCTGTGSPRTKCGLRCDCIEYSDSSLETVCSCRYTLLEGCRLLAHQTDNGREYSHHQTKRCTPGRICQIDSLCAICLQFSPGAAGPSPSSSRLIEPLISDERTAAGAGSESGPPRLAGVGAPVG